MVTVVFVRNPFDPYQSRSVEHAEDGKTLTEYVQPYRDKVPFNDLTVQVNGKIAVEFDGIVPKNAFIVVMVTVGKGGGKNPLQLIASIALSVVAMGVGSVLAGGAFFGAGALGIGAWGLPSFLGAAATMFLGGSLVSKLGPKISVGKYNTTESDPTYSWDGVTTMEGQGNAIALTYGTVKSGGQSIAKYVSNNENDQVLNWLVCAGEGPLEIEDIRLNDNPIENYKDVSVEIRPGTNNQEIISNFNDTIETKQLGYEILDDEWRLDEVAGNSAEGLIIDIEFTQGLYHVNDDGSLSTAWVQITAQYRLKVEGQGDDDGWQTLVSSTPYAKSNQAKATLINTDAALGSWTVKIGRYDVSGSDEDPEYQWQVRVWAPGQKTTGLSGLMGGSRASIEGSGGVNCGPFNFPDKALLRNLGSGTQISISVVNDSRISAAQTTAVRRQFRFDNIPAGEYQVRVKANARSAATNSTRDGVRCYWSGLSAIIYDDFIYPNKALIGLKALASNQLSGNTPTLTFLKTRSTVLVYNPNLPGYEEKDATNPAWAAYDFTHLARLLDDPRDGTQKIVVNGAPAELIMYDRFAEWAEYCDEMDLHINIEIASTGEYWNKVNTDIAPVGRGKVLQFGTRFGCIWDHVQEPVQMFTMGNIVSGSFTETYLALKDRADCVELTFNNRDKDYTRDTIVAYGPDYDKTEIVNNPTQISMDGITDYKQAYREAKYQLYCNALLKRSVSFTAQIDAISCMVGDVILVAHDVPQWSYSGRIYEVNGLYAVTVPIDPDGRIWDDEYSFQYRSQNDVIHTLDVTSITASGDMLLIEVIGFDETDMPQKNDIFALGPRNATSKPFTVTSITRADDYTRKIEAIEYNAAVFEENYDVPMPDYSMSEETDVQNVINLEAKQIAYKDKQGTLRCKMFVSWQLPEGALADYFSVHISDDYGRTWQLMASPTGFECSFETQPFTAYMVRVITVYQMRQSSGVIIGPIAEGVDVLPPDVSVINAEVVGEGAAETRRFYWKFEYPDPDDIAGFKIKYLQGNSLNWNVAYELHTGFVTQQPFETKALRQGIHTVMIKAVDNAGQESEHIAYTVLNLGDPLEDNVLYKNDFATNDWEHCITNGTQSGYDDYIHAPQNSYFWATPDTNAWVQNDWAMWYERYSSFYLVMQFKALASGAFWLRYDIEGPAKIEYRTTGDQPFWRGNADTAFWEAPDWAMWPDDANLYKPYTCKVNVKAGDLIQVRFTAPENVTEETLLKSLTAIIDVPDREEHFENITVPASGLELPIVTPDYYTTAVKVDAMQTSVPGGVELEIISRTPCIIRFNKLTKGASITRTPIQVVADVTWQGFENEVI